MSLLVITSCATLDPSERGEMQQGPNYFTFGSVKARKTEAIRKVIDARNAYCSATDEGSRAVLKQIAIAAIKTQFPPYPVDGICTQLFMGVFDMIPVQEDIE